MTLEEEGAYRRLLDYQWLNGFIPSDLGQLARLCKGISKTRMERIWTVINECFIPCTGGFMNLKMEKVRDEQRRFREERSASGRKGAAAKHGSATGSATKEPQANSGSASSSASATAIEKKTSPSERPKKAPTDPPQVFEISDGMRDWAEREGFGNPLILTETAKMLDHFRGKGQRRSDWPATWRNWMRNTHRFGGTNGNGRPKSKADIVRENCESVLALADSETGGSGECGN